MRSTIRRLASVLAIVLAGAALAAGSAAAAPVNAPNSATVSLDCGDAGTFDVVISSGGGDWIPGHIVGDGGVLVPVAFGEETFTLTDAEGNVLVEETEPAQAKGKAKPKRNRTVVECTYSATFELEGNTATVSGSVTAFRSGRSA